MRCRFAARNVSRRGAAALALVLAVHPVHPVLAVAAAEQRDARRSDMVGGATARMPASATVTEAQLPAAEADLPAPSTAIEPHDADAAAARERSSGLEGPPVPLPPISRLDASASRADPAAQRTWTRQAEPGRPITMTFRRAPLAAVLESFAEFTGLNIIAGENVRGTVSIRLKEVPWRAAFDALLEAHGLAMQRRGNVIWVATAAELAARQRQRLEAHARVAHLEPLATRSFELHFQRAHEVQKMLAGQGAQRLLSKRGMALADARTDRLFVTDLPEYLDQIEMVLKAIDHPARQVMIEARIVEADQSFSRNLGVRLALQGVGPHAGAGAGAGDTGAARDAAAPGSGASFDVPAGPLSGFPAAAAGIGLFGAGATRLLALELSALETDGRGRILSSPRVVTADRVKALIEQGTELPYQAKVGNGVSAVQFRRAGLKLEVEPHITPDGHVILDLDIAKDSVGMETASGPAINTKHIQTRVQVENGGTVAIGGIYTEDGRRDVARLPLIGRLPILGALFRNQARSERKSELLVFITPSVVSGLQPPASHALEAPRQAPRATGSTAWSRFDDWSDGRPQGSTKHAISP